jgi:hypothetical protein
MGARIEYFLDTGVQKYPQIEVIYDGTQVSRFYKDQFLKNIISTAIRESSDSNDTYDYCNLIFSYINNAVRRRYNGQELQLYRVTVIESNEFFAVSSTR